MKKILAILISGIIMVIMTACPYHSEIALSDPKNSEIDSLLLGQWVSKNIKDSADMGELNITNLNNNQLLVELKPYDPNDSLETWRGFITKVGNQKILNLSGKEKSFTFIKYTTDGSTLKVSIASDNFIKKEFSNQKELFEFFQQNINKKELFENVIVLKKKNNKR